MTIFFIKHFIKPFVAMLKYLLLCLLATSQGISARPSHSVAGDLASHILIVTPQAQVHLEPALKYDSVVPNTFIQHLSPYARIAAPHEETIIYVPSGSAASMSLARSSAALAEPVRRQDTKQYEQISQQIEQVQGAIQQGSSALGPQLSEAASAAASAASNAGTGLFPALFPPAAGASAQKDDKYKPDKIEYEAIAATTLLSGGGEARRYYALTPAVSHVIDFVHAPVFVGPLSAIRARSIQAGEESEAEKLIDAIPTEESLQAELPLKDITEKKASEVLKETPRIEAIRLKEDLKRPEQREEVPEHKQDVLEEKKIEEKKLDESRLEKKKIEDTKVEEKKPEIKKLEESKTEEKKPEEIKFEQKKLEDNPVEAKKQEEKKVEEKKIEEPKIEKKKMEEKRSEEKRTEEKRSEEKRSEEKNLSKKPIEQQLLQEPQPLLLQQPLQKQEPLQQLVDKTKPLEKELEKAIPIQQPIQLQQQPIQERKEQSIQERKEESKQLEQQPLLKNKEQPLQKQLLEPKEQQQLPIQLEVPAQPQPQQLLQQQKQLQPQAVLFEKPAEDQKELLQKREELKELKELKKEETAPSEILKTDSVKSAEPELNKITGELPKEKILPQTFQQPQQQPLQLQRAVGGRLEGAEVSPLLQHAHHDHEEVQQPKSVGVTPVDPVAVVPVFVPQVKTV